MRCPFLGVPLSVEVCVIALRGPAPRLVKFLLVLCVLLSFSQSALSDTKRILLLHHPAWRKEETALLEALRIYTRDLDGAIVSADAAGEKTQTGWNRALPSVAEQGKNASAMAVAWFIDDGGLRFYTLLVATMDLQIMAVQPRDDLDVAAQTLALKLRAFLLQASEQMQSSTSQPAGSIDGEPGSRRSAKEDRAIAPHQAEGASPASQDRTETTAADSVSTRPLPKSTTLLLSSESTPAQLPSAKPQRPIHVEVGFGYGLDVPVEPSWLRHQLVLRTALVLSRFPIAVELDGAVATQPSVDVSPYQVTIADSPIGLALSLRLVRPRFVLALGPRTSLHIIQAELGGAATPSGPFWRFSAGLGATAQGRIRLLRFMSLQLAVLAEGTVPRQKFTVGGVAAADLGSFRFGSSLGVLFEIL